MMIKSLIILFVYILFGRLKSMQCFYNCTNITFDPDFNTIELLAYLTHPCFYDKQTSPLHGFNQQKTDLIVVRLHIYYLRQKLSKNLEFQAQLLTELCWLDPRLAYASKNATIDVIQGEENFLNQIWVPQIYLTAARVPLIEGKWNKDTTVNVLANGTVMLNIRLITDVICWSKLGRFPLDQQKCNLNIDTWRFKSKDLQLKWNGNLPISWSEQVSFIDEYRLLDIVYITNYDLTEPNSINSHVYNCSSLGVIFSVTRNRGYYFMNYYFPSILIVALSWVTFWEAPNAIPGAMTLLTFIAVGVDVSKSLPAVSYIRSNDLWFIGCTAFIFCSLAEFAFVNTLWRYGGEVELKKATSKYIIKSSLGVGENMRFRQRSMSWSTAPSRRWENPLKRVVNNELTVKSLSDLEIALPLSELKTTEQETLEVSDVLAKPPTTMSCTEIAVWIDKKSRIVFPSFFVIFNVIYWSLLVVS